MQFLELQIFFYELITPKRPLTLLINLDKILLQKCETMVQQDSTRLTESTHILFAIFGLVELKIWILQVYTSFCHLIQLRKVPSKL